MPVPGGLDLRLRRDMEWTAVLDDRQAPQRTRGRRWQQQGVLVTATRAPGPSVWRPVSTTSQAQEPTARRQQPSWLTAGRLKITHALTIDADFDDCRDRDGRPLIREPVAGRR